MNLVFALASVAVVTVSCLYLLVCVDKYDKSWKGQVRNYFYSLPPRVKLSARKYKLEFIYSYGERLATYICFKKNPIL